MSEFWKDKTVFVTGGSGFIGSHLCKKLYSMGAKVKSYFHKTHSPYADFSGDLADVASMKRLHDHLKAIKPDVVFHLAAQPLVNNGMEKMYESLTTNVVGSYHLLLACMKVPSIQSIVFISTDKVYGDIPEISYDTIPNGDRHPYNASKLASDVIARMFGNFAHLPICVVRNGNVYGPGDTHFERIVPRTFVRAYKGLQPVIRGKGLMTRDYIHVHDIVDAYICAAEYQWGLNFTSVANIGSTRKYSVAEMVDEVLRASGRIDLRPIYEEPLGGEIPHQHINDPISNEMIGWAQKIGLSEGIDSCAHYYKEYVKDHKDVQV